MEREKNILIKYMLYFAVGIIICIIGITNAFALTYENAEGYKNDITIVLVAPDYSDSPINVPINSEYALNQVREVIIQVNNFNFIANRNYQLEMYLPRQDLGRANFYTVQGNNREACIISYDNSAFDGEFPRWAFQCPTATNNITIDIKNSNNQILWDNGANGAPVFKWGYSYLRYSNTSLTGNGIASDDIINNQNQNTQNIINNQNQNTQNIINNQNQNTQNIIDSNKVCTQIDKNNAKSNYYINNNGEEIYQSGLSWGVTDYINIYNSQVTVLEQYTSGSTSTRVCYYNINKEKISCLPTNEIQAGILNYPTNAYYMRSSIQMNINKPQFEICKNGNQAIIESNEEAETTRKGILGKIGELLSYINPTSENFFVYKLLELLEELLKKLFVPSKEYLTAWYTDFKNWIELKLGFLATPILLFLDFIELYLNLEETDIIINIPNITVPNFENITLIQAQTFDWGELMRSKTEFLNMWNLYLDFIDVFLILNFLGLCEVTYNRIFGGDTTQYEYYTTEETYNINDDTGEATNHQLRQRRTRRERIV